MSNGDNIGRVSWIVELHDTEGEVMLVQSDEIRIVQRVPDGSKVTTRLGVVVVRETPSEVWRAYADALLKNVDLLFEVVVPAVPDLIDEHKDAAIMLVAKLYETFGSLR